MDSVKKAMLLMKELGIEGDVIKHQSSGKSSIEASEALGVPLSRILKSLVFTEKGEYIFVITTGDRRVSVKKLRLFSGMKRPRMATPEEIFSILGYEPGGVPPFAFYGIMPCYIEKAVLMLDWVIGSAGSEYAGIKLKPYDLVKIGCRPHDLSE